MARLKPEKRLMYVTTKNFIGRVFSSGRISLLHGEGCGFEYRLVHQFNSEDGLIGKPPGSGPGHRAGSIPALPTNFLVFMERCVRG